MRFNRPIGYLYRLFRREFVTEYSKPLCSDAFSPFIRPTQEGRKMEGLMSELKDIHGDIQSATVYLRETLIPQFVQVLYNMNPLVRDQVDLIQELHFHGINVRYLGTVLSLLDRRPAAIIWRARILIEMTSRSIKDAVNELLREKMRLFKYPGEASDFGCPCPQLIVPFQGIYLRQVVNFLNRVISNDEDELWETKLSSVWEGKFESPTGLE